MMTGGCMWCTCHLTLYNIINDVGDENGIVAIDDVGDVETVK